MKTNNNNNDDAETLTRVRNLCAALAVQMHEMQLQVIGEKPTYEELLILYAHAVDGYAMLAAILEPEKWERAKRDMDAENN